MFSSVENTLLSLLHRSLLTISGPIAHLSFQQRNILPILTSGAAFVAD